jgi:AcrR family transcriptional regulator
VYEYDVRNDAMPRELSTDEIDAFRARICDAAARLYVKKGEDAITMRELAKALDCSPMGLYRYFKDRDEIIAGVRTDAFNRFADALEAAFAKGTDPFSRAREVGRAYLAFALDNPNLYRLMFDLSPASEKRHVALIAASARAGRTVTRHVKDLIAAGIVKGDAEKIGHALWAASHGVIVLHLSGRLPASIDVEELYIDTMRLTFRGARTPASGARRRTQSSSSKLQRRPA